MSFIDPYSTDDIKRKKDNFFLSGRESEKGFEPRTSPFEISGTSFLIQFGTINEQWASVLLRGNNVIATHIYNEEDLSGCSFPNQSLVVDWVMGIAAIPDIDPREIIRLIQTITLQFEEK